jgi:DNA-binding response OmpR family regulator
MKRRILVVEDDPHISAVLVAELERLGFVVRMADTAAGALDAALSWSPSLMLLDMGLPDLDGSAVLRRIRARGDTLPVIFLTARDHRDDRVDALRAGADDYIVKPFDIGELDARIQAVLRRSGQSGPQVIDVGALRLMADEARIFLNDQALALTPRELHILRRLIQSANRVVTKEQLLDLLATQNEDIGLKSVEVYVHRIRNKIEGHDVEIVTVRGFGYVLRQRSA